MTGQEAASQRERLRKTLRGFLSWLDYCEENAVVLIYAAMIILTGSEVFVRYVLNDAIQWSEEVSRYAFIWIVFLGAPLGILRGIHIGMDILYRQASPRVQIVLSVVSHAGMLFFFYFLFRMGLEAVQLGRFQLTPALQISKAWVYAVIPIGGALMMLATLRRLVLELTNRERSENLRSRWLLPSG